jgi:hypothetical protein
VGEEFPSDCFSAEHLGEYLSELKLEIKTTHLLHLLGDRRFPHLEDLDGDSRAIKHIFENYSGPPNGGGCVLRVGDIKRMRNDARFWEDAAFSTQVEKAGARAPPQCFFSFEVTNDL